MRQLLARSVHQLVRERVGAATGIGLRTRNICDELVPGSQATARNAHGTILKRVAVVGFLSRRGGSQRHGALRDGERAVEDFELHVGEVDAVVLEVLGLEVHLVRAGIGALGNLIVSGANELDIRGGIFPVRDVAKLVALDGLFETAVILRARFLGDGDDHLVGVGRHFKLAGVVRDAVVGGLGTALEHNAFLHHVARGFADIGDGAVDLSGCDIVLANEAFGGELAFRLSGGQRRPVVSPGRRAGGHGHLGRLDGQRARGDADGELRRHVVAVRVGHLIAAFAARDDIFVGASIRARNVRMVIENSVLNAVEGPLILLHARHRVLFAVIGSAVIALTHQRDGVLLVVRTMLHRQRSLRSGDAVVVPVRPLLELPAIVLDGAGRGAALGLRALDGNVGDVLAVDEALGSKLRVGLISGQRAAVVFLFRGPSRDRHRTRIDGELSVLSRDLELVGHVVAMGVGNDDVGNLVLIRAGVHLALGTGRLSPNGELNAFFISIGGRLQAGCAMRLPIIAGRAACTFDGDLVLLVVGTLVHVQLSVLVRDLVVIEVGTGTGLALELVVITAGGDVVLVEPFDVLVVHALALDEAVALEGLLGGGVLILVVDVLRPVDANVGLTLERAAVVVLMAVLGPQGHLSLGDLKRTVDDFELHLGVVAVRRNEASGSKPHIVGAGILALGLSRCALRKGDLRLIEAVGRLGHVPTGDGLLLAVVFLGTRLARNLHDDLVGNRADVQVAVRRPGHDVLVIGADLADGAIRERIRVVTGVRALAALERHAVEAGALAPGKVRLVAFDALLGAVIGFGIGVRRQRNVLAVVELHHVLGLVGTELEVLDVIADRRIAVDRLRLKSGDLVAHMAPIALGRKQGVRARPVVLDTIAHLICSVEEVDGGIGAHHGCLLAGKGRVALNGNGTLRNRLTLHVAGKGLGRRNLDCGPFKIVIHLDRLVASHILAVVVHVLARAHGERYRLRASLVGVPTHELIFHVIDGLFGSRGFGRGGNLRNALFQLVRGSIILSEAGRIGILQIEHRVNRLAALHHHLAVKVVPTTDIRIIRNLVRIKSDFLHVVFRDLSALLLGKRVLPCLENGVPVLAVGTIPVERPARPRAAVRPLRHAVRYVVVAVLATREIQPIKIDLHPKDVTSTGGKPGGSAVAVRVGGGAILEEQETICRRGFRPRYRHLVGGSEHLALRGDRGCRDGDRAQLDADHLAGGIDGGHRGVA